VHESPTQIPTEQYNHFGYAASGEAFALGVRVKTGLPRVQRGDIVGVRLLLDMQRVVFYLNNKPVVELVDLPTYEQYFPCCTLGNAGYQVKINPCPRIPLGVSRWLDDSMQPPRYLTLQDNMVAKAVRASQCVTVTSAVEYEMGKEYFEVTIMAIHPEAELCIGIASKSRVCSEGGGCGVRATRVGCEGGVHAVVWCCVGCGGVGMWWCSKAWNSCCYPPAEDGCVTTMPDGDGTCTAVGVGGVIILLSHTWKILVGILAQLRS